MKQILFDFTFWVGVILTVVGFVLFKAVNSSLKKQEEKFEDPKKNLEKLMREWIKKCNSIFGEENFRIHSNVRMAVIIPAFMMAVGIIAILVSIIK